MFKHVATALMIGALTVGAAACGSEADGAVPSPAAPGTDADDPTGDPTGDQAGDPFAACPVGDADCYEDGTGRPGPDPSGDEFPVDASIEAAHGLLGLADADLPPDVRIARRGEERFALTEDYVLGRMTVELDDTDGSGFRVVQVTVELPDGPQTFELTPS